MTNDKHKAEAAALLKPALLHANLIGLFELKAYVQAAMTMGGAAVACQMNARTQVDAIALLYLQANDQGIRHSTRTTPKLHARRAGMSEGLKRPMIAEQAFTHLAALTARKVAGDLKQSRATTC